MHADIRKLDNKSIHLIKSKHELDMKIIHPNKVSSRKHSNPHHILSLHPLYPELLSPRKLGIKSQISLID